MLAKTTKTRGWIWGTGSLLEGKGREEFVCDLVFMQPLITTALLCSDSTSRHVSERCFRRPRTLFMVKTAIKAEWILMQSDKEVIFGPFQVITVVMLTLLRTLPRTLLTR